MQAELIQIGVGGVLVLNTSLLLRLAFVAGQWGEKLISFERRITLLETKSCPHVDCPLRLELGSGEKE